MANLSEEIKAYDQLSADLEAKAMGQWALVHDTKLVGTYASFEAAAQIAIEKFGRGPYLIRQIGSRQVTLPASVMYHPVHG